MFEICKLYYEFSSPEEMGLHHDIPTITFRGAFGYALAQVIARDGCIPELRSQVKLYKQFFMPQNDGLCDSRNLDLARPFILRGFYSRPDKCSFILEISLFGIAIEYESFFDRVVEVMSYMGIGKNRTVCHYEKLNKVYLKPTLPEVTDLLQVFFLTPCVRLKHKGQIFEESIPFEVLLPRLLDRLLELDNLYGDGNWKDQWDIAEMKHYSASGKISSTFLQGGLYQAKRRSGRTGQEMNLSGFIGKMLYCGDFQQYAGALAYLPLVNLGRFNVFGCGWCNAEFIHKTENQNKEKL